MSNGLSEDRGDSLKQASIGESRENPRDRAFEQKKAAAFVDDVPSGAERQKLIDTYFALATNPLLNAEVPLPFIASAESIERGNPLVKVGDESIQGNAAPSTIYANQKFEIATGQQSEKFFMALQSPHLKRFISDDQIVALGKIGVSGFGLDSNYELVPSNTALPLPLRSCVALCRVGASWNVGESGARVAQPLMLHRGAAVVPLIGDLILNGETLSEEVLNQLGVGAAGFEYTTEAGEKKTDLIKYPIFGMGGRSALLPMASSIPVQKTREGGLRIIYDAAVMTANDSEDYGMIPTVAFQWTGVGIGRYVYHSIWGADTNKLQENGEVEIELTSGKTLQGGVKLVQRQNCAGKAGVLLDVRHQPQGDAPTGGLTTGEISFKRDQLMFARGAVMSSITTAVLTLFTREELDRALGRPSGMVCDKLEVGIKAVLDDTRRMDQIIPILNEQSCKEQLARFFNVDSDAISRERVIPFLRGVAETLGKNTRILLDLGLVLPTEQRLVDNVSVYGGFADSENLKEQDNRYQFFALMRESVRILVKISDAADIPRRELWDAKSNIAAPFVFAIFGQRSGEKLLMDCSAAALFFGSSAGENAALYFSQAWIKRSLAQDGLRINGQKAARFILGDSELAKGLSAEYRSFLRDLGSERGSFKVVVSDRAGKARELSAERYFDQEILPLFLIATVERAMSSLVPGAEVKGKFLVDLEEKGVLNGECYR